MSSAEALVVSGGGRFGDPWHRFPETSATLATALTERGFTVEVSDDADASLAVLDLERLPSLLVLNIGGKETDRLAEPATQGLVAALRRGLPTLLVHSSLTAFPGWPLWREIAGGAWIQGSTYHPDYGPGVALADPGHPLTTGLDADPIIDERYTRLWVDDTVIGIPAARGGRPSPSRSGGRGHGAGHRSWWTRSGTTSAPTARPAG